jgi:hypothetical protein
VTGQRRRATDREADDASADHEHAHGQRSPPPATAVARLVFDGGARIGDVLARGGRFCHRSRKAKAVSAV